MSVNVQNVERLCDHLKGLVKVGREDKFMMGEYLYDQEVGEPISYLSDSVNPTCGTAGCLAGHMIIMDQVTNYTPEVYLQGQLGLDKDETHYMTLGYWADRTGMGLSSITIEQAIDYLDHVIATGSVYLSGDDD